MKNLKPLIIGFAVGAVCMMSMPVIAAGYKNVEAMLLPEAMFKFDDKLVASPSDQPVLNYKGYTYVPIRFVAEELGCEVNWDIASRQVHIKAPKQEVVERIVEKPVEQIVYVDKDSTEAKGNKIYSELPVKKGNNKYNLTLKTVIMEDSDKDFAGPRKTRTYISVDNLDVDRIEVEQIEAMLILDGREIKMAERDNLWDSRWDEESIKKGIALEGYLVFDGIVSDYTVGTLKVPIKISDDEGFRREVIEINFKR